MIKKCTQCGKCCLNGSPCTFAQIFFNITKKNPAVCPACYYEDGKWWCGLVTQPQKWFGPLVGNEEWKYKAMADIARIFAGIGAGCRYSPVIQDANISLLIKKLLSKI